jgi:hypothetical protein
MQEKPHEDDNKLCDSLLNDNKDRFVLPQTSLLRTPTEEVIKLIKVASEQELMMYIHHDLVPSATILAASGNRDLSFIETQIHRLWVDCSPILSSRPKPDHCAALKRTAFSDEEYKKLGTIFDHFPNCFIQESLYFPFLTVEVKSGNQSLQIANEQNQHSMCLSLRALVELARISQREKELHGRVLGFAIQHDFTSLEIYAWYPSITQGREKYSFKILKQSSFWVESERNASYRFVRNLYERFAGEHLKLVKDLLSTIDFNVITLPTTAETETPEL